MTFLLNDIYEPYKDEIVGWRVVPLKGNLSKLEDCCEEYNSKS